MSQKTASESEHKLLTSREACTWLAARGMKASPGLMSTWRTAHIGPSYSQGFRGLRGVFLYAEADLQVFLEARQTQTQVEVPKATPGDGRLSSREAAAWLTARGMKTYAGLMSVWRAEGLGPAYFKSFRGLKSVSRYAVEDLQTFLDRFIQKQVRVETRDSQP